MTKEEKNEIKMFLIYMDLVINAQHDLLNGEGYQAVMKLVDNFPQFVKRHDEVEKIMEWLDNE